MPPCSERVKWFVGDVMKVPSSQIDALKAKLATYKLDKPNARSPQALNGRTVYRCGRESVLLSEEHKMGEKVEEHKPVA
eukprot:CAMPEP_0116899030 /NCGR_PEP_ID=MMETSP0467-20121206/7672_1 /TAXON_ID=283647 /ORGANISM="Mesodinium pulex, Strain SPMC105" /LENGTH=78 /DNA_ID=CAMNT_0004571589 /DNA_START=591 /DNA_END=827 /DNA_ORIENTATION=+